ncbi:MAG: ribulose-phosphate 3-epimerase [Atopobiaceae bacterium]|nr:ribulose-phosphate 3-epimerase [Atopobiaceae bacterium]
MTEDVKIAPSILACDFLRLGDQVASISNADFVHYDVMDGHFVPNLSFGPDILRQVAASTDVPVDAHLMISNPDTDAVRYVQAGASMVTFHMEATNHAHRVLYAIKDAGAQAGVVLNPSTPIIALDAIIEDVDMVLLMSVNPGFGGQSFIKTTLRKLRQLRALCFERGVEPLIEVDGGVGIDNVADVCAAGANVIVAGSAVFRSDDPAKVVDDLRQAGRAGLAKRL